MKLTGFSNPLGEWGRMKKTLWIMKLTAFFLVVSCFQVSASFSQSVTISVKNSSLQKVFKEINQQTGFEFFFQDALLEKADKVNIDVKNASIEQVLDICFSHLPVSYTIVDNTIIVKSSEQTIGSAQPQRVTGKVTDLEGNPVTGVNVLVKGTYKGVITDELGNYSITVNQSSDTLQYSFIGFKSVEERINGRTVIDIKLKEELQKIEEVVATGMFTRRAESYTGNISTITSKELRESGNRNVITSLRNIDPSFNIIESNTFGSDPNRLPEIQIRGNSSLPNVDQLKDATRVGLNTPLVCA